MIRLREGDRVRITGEVTDERLLKYSDDGVLATVLRCSVPDEGVARCLVQFDRPDGMYGLYWLDAGILSTDAA